MSFRASLFGSASRFSHFGRPAAAARAEDDSPEDTEASRAKADEADGDNESARKAEEEEEAKKARKARRARKAKRARRASEDDRDPDDDGDDDEGDDAADDKETEEDDADMRKAAASGHDFALEAAFRAGARAQRRRCAAILACPEAAANPAMAMKMAFETSMTAASAIDVLKTTPSARGGGLASRMASSPAAGVRVAPSAPSGPTGPAAIAASWDAAMSAVIPTR